MKGARILWVKACESEQYFIYLGRTQGPIWALLKTIQFLLYCGFSPNNYWSSTENNNNNAWNQNFNNGNQNNNNKNNNNQVRCVRSLIKYTESCQLCKAKDD